MTVSATNSRFASGYYGTQSTRLRNSGSVTENMLVFISPCFRGCLVWSEKMHCLYLSLYIEVMNVELLTELPYLWLEKYVYILPFTYRAERLQITISRLQITSRHRSQQSSGRSRVFNIGDIHPPSPRLSLPSSLSPFLLPALPSSSLHSSLPPSLRLFSISPALSFRFPGATPWSPGAVHSE